MGLQNMNVLHRILRLALGICHPHFLHCGDNHLPEEVGLGGKKLGAHRSLGSLQDRLISEVILAHNQRSLDEVDGLFERHTISSHDRGWVNLVFDQIVGSFQKFSGQDDNRSSAVTNLAILNLGKLNEYFCGRVRHLKLLENGGAIVRDRHIADVINEHLVEALRTERGLHDVGERSDCHDVLGSDILTLFTLTKDSNLCHVF